MRKLVLAMLMFLLTTGLWAQTTPATDDAAQLRQEIEQLKKAVNALEQRLNTRSLDCLDTTRPACSPWV